MRLGVLALSVTVLLVAALVASTRDDGGSGKRPERAAIKPPLAGLIWLNEAPTPGRDLPAGGVALSVRWAELQPERGTVRHEVIERALTGVAAELPVKLRVLAGNDAPEWVKRLGGPPVSLSDPQRGGAGTVPRFWTPEVGEAYDGLQQQLAQRFDEDPRLAEVTISRCTTFHAEPAIRQVSDPANAVALLAAGYSVDADLRCQEDAMAAHDVWVRTRSGLAMNPYQRIDDDGAASIDVATTVALLRHCREILAQRCVLENNSIRWPPLAGEYTAMYEQMQELGPPVLFQTAGSRRVGDWVSTLEWAVDQGALAVEVEPGQVEANIADAARLHDALVANG